MASIVVQVPEGQFCGDKNWLTCIYDEAHEGNHYCGLFHEALEKVEIRTPEGERQRALYKCSKCLELVVAIKPDRALEATSVTEGWEFP